MKQIRIIILGCMLINGVTRSNAPHYGICCVPVADLTIEPITSLSHHLLPEQRCAQQLLGPSYNNHSVTRINQLLLNEPVIILNETDYEYKIQTIDRAYSTAIHTYNSTYWVEKYAITPTSTAPCTNQDALFLIRPYYIPELGVTVSAGTKLFLKKTKTNHYLATCIHPKTYKLTTCTIAQSLCCRPYKNPQKQRLAFVQLIRFWAQQHPEKIPYVLGGSSIKDTVIPSLFSLRTMGSEKNASTGYWREQLDCPYTGLDCSHLVYLAARMTGIPIKTTNTIGISKECRLFTKHDTLEAGDLALWKGHVIIITDPENGLCAEARGYDSGYGVVHEIPLDEQLKGIKTGNDLVTTYFSGNPITRLKKYGEFEKVITDMRLYKLPI